MYQEFKNADDADVHILFTTRPPYCESKDSFSEDLTEINRQELKPFEDVNELIMHFAERHDSMVFSQDIHEKIKEVTTIPLTYKPGVAK